jgi:hypothetical protein
VSDIQVCVMGAGVTGALTACLLHDAGLEVLLVDQAADIVTGASRWNEGKIHLGYTFTGTPSFATASLLIAGAARFEAIVSAVTGRCLADEWYSQPVIYLVGTSSIVPADVLWQRAGGVASLLVQGAEQLPGLRRYVNNGPVLTRLSVEEAEARTGQRDFTAAWRTSERSIAPGPVADLLRRAVSERDIARATARIVGVTESDGAWSVRTEGGAPIGAQTLVNCLWESRPAIDRVLVAGYEPVSIRYKAALFGDGMPGWEAVEPSTRILGAFGDVTPYGNGDVYLSWYPAGLLGLSDTGDPPHVAMPDEAVMRRVTLDGLGIDVPESSPAVSGLEVHGGFIVAGGWGDITERSSPLHDRSAPDAIELAPGYVSVDTGKYSLGPLMAVRAARLVLGHDVQDD